ncbi:MAG TPA: efflux RND transporter periplasmic adaptor subunit [Bacteroidota bacterium]|nr:efflux RND transporter periplasmic adaptor subunit [Bacteroidota bacterium]
MKNKKWYIVAGIVLVFALILLVRILQGNASSDQRRQSAPLVRCEPPRQETVYDELSYTGDILPIQQASIYSKVSGNLEKIYVDIGTQVKEGELLALIDTTELVQQLQQTSATYENNRLAYERNKELIGQNLIARQDLDNAEAAMKVARAAYETARTRLGYAYITAPFSGIITKRYLDQGANVTSDNTLLYTLMDMNSMKMIIPIQEKDLPRVTKGKKAIISVDAYPGKTFDGVVTRLSQAVDLTSRTMDVQIDIPNPGALLKPGMYANVQLIVAELANGLTLPTISILKDEQGLCVYTVQGNVAHRITVVPGVEKNGRTQIVSGLHPGDRVVTVGQQFVKDGGTVQIQQ